MPPTQSAAFLGSTSGPWPPGLSPSPHPTGIWGYKQMAQSVKYMLQVHGTLLVGQDPQNASGGFSLPPQPLLLTHIFDTSVLWLISRKYVSSVTLSLKHHQWLPKSPPLRKAQSLCLPTSILRTQRGGLPDPMTASPDIVGGQ